jgi:hypothetical protein
MENNFEKKMEQLKTPETDFIKHQEVFKIGLLNAKKSSRIGIIFILIPAIILLVGYIKLQFLMKIDYSATLENYVLKVGNNVFLQWGIPFIFMGLPMLAIIINLLAITHFYINKTNKELIISIRYKLKNLIVLIIGFITLLTFLSYIIIENVYFK